jgi:hypothetical protein
MATKTAKPANARVPKAQTTETLRRKPMAPAALASIPWWIAAAVLLVLTLIFHNQLLFGGKFLWEDFVEQEFPFRTLAASSLAGGMIPQWNPYVFAGMPFIADIQVAFWYPMNILQSLFVSSGHLSPVVMQWFILLHYAIAGIGMFFFLTRIVKVDDWSGLFGAIAYAFCGYIVGQAMHQMIVYHIALFPWVAFAFIRGVDEWKWTIVAGLLLGVMYLSGHPQSTLYFSVLLAALAAYELTHRLRHDEGGFNAMMVVRMAVVLVIALGVFAIQILPSQELAALSRRDVITYDKSLEGSLAWGNILTLILPRLFGITTAAGAADSPYWNGAYYLSWETAMYIGILPLFFAVMAGLVGWKRKYVPLFASTAVVALLFALGDHFFLYKIFFNLPLFGKFRTPARMLTVFSFSAIVLAAIGLSEALRTEAPKWGKAPGIVLRILIFLPWMLAIAGSLAATSFNPQAAPEAADAIKHAASLATFPMLSFLAITLLHYLNKLRGSALAVSVIAVTVIELFMYGMSVNASPEDPREAFAEHQEVVQQLKQDQAHEISRARTRMGNAMILKRNDGAYDRIQLIEGYNPLVLQRVSPETKDPEASADLMNIKWSIMPSQSGFGWGERSTYLPRVKMYYRAEVLPDSQARLRLASDSSFDYRNTILLEEQPSVQIGTLDPSAVATVASYTANEIRASVHSTAPGVLFFSEVWYPAWHAYVDAKESRLLRAFTSLRAVEVPAGTHSVVLRYESAAFASGSLITLVTLALSAAGLVVLGMRKRPARTDAIDEALV